MASLGLVFGRGLVGILAFGLVGSAFADDPRGKDPAISLAVRPHPVVEQLVSESQKLATSIQKELTAYAEARATGKLKALAFKAIGGTFADAVKLQRHAVLLELWGETAGVDFRLRAMRFQGELSELIRTYRALPGVNDTLRKGFPTVSNRANQLAKELPTVAKFSAQGKDIEAESILNAWLDELEVFLCWFDPPDREAATKVFAKAKDVVMPRAFQLRKDNIAGELAKLRGEALPDFMALAAEAKAAAESVKTSGKAMVDGKSASGPEVVSYLAGKWMAGQAAAARARALDWARGISPGTPAQKEFNTLVEAQQAWSGQMKDLLVSVVQGDAMRATAEEAPALYKAYVQSLAPLAVAAAGFELEKSLEPPLAMLAAKAPPLAEEVASYRRATSEILRWRKLAAESKARTFAIEYVAASPLVAPLVRADAAFGGLLPAEAMMTDGARLRICVPEVLKRAQVPLTGKKVVLGDWMRGVASPSTMVNRPAGRIYCQIGIPAEIKPEVDALKRDLQVTENLPPLTLASAIALYEAESGAAAQVGLEISDLALVSLVDRQATLPVAEASWLTLGALPNENPKQVDASDVYLRLEGTPRWIRFSTFLWEKK